MSTARQWFHKHIPAAMDIYTTEELFITLRAKLVPVKIILYIKIFKYFKMMYYVAQCSSFLCPVFAAMLILVMCTLVAGVWNTMKQPTKYTSQQKTEHKK